MSEANKAAFREADSPGSELADDVNPANEAGAADGLSTRIEERIGRPLTSAEKLINDAPRRQDAAAPDSTPEGLLPEEGLGDDLLARIEARLGRPLSAQEGAILSRPLTKEPSLSYLAYQILAELRSRREKLLIPASSVLSNDLMSSGKKVFARPWTELLMALWCVPLLFSNYMQSGKPNVWLLGLFVATLVQSILILATELRLKKKVDAGMQDISLIMRAIEADPDLLEIREHVPPPWSWLFFSGRYAGLKDYVRLLSANLDWYLGPPRLLLRWSWITGPLGAAALATALGLWVFSAATPGVTTLAIGLAGFYVMMNAIRHESSRRAYFIDKLIELLRRP